MERSCGIFDKIQKTSFSKEIKSKALNIGKLREQNLLTRSEEYLFEKVDKGWKNTILQ